MSVPSRAASDGGGAMAVFYSILNRIAMIALQMATGILTARVLHPQGRGELAAMILWPLFLASVTSLGIPSSLIYFIRKRNSGRRSLIMHGFALSIGFGCIAAGISALLLPRWLHQYSPAVIHGAELFLFTIPLCSIMMAGQASLEALGRFSASNATQILVPMSTLAGLLGFYCTHRLTPFTAAIAYVASSVPVAALILFYLWRERNPESHWQWSVAECRLLLSYGIRSYGIDLLNALSERVDAVLVIALLAPSAMGVYAVMLSLSRTLNVFQSAVAMVLFPKTAGQPLDAIVELTEVAVRISAMITALCAAVLCIVGPILVALLYGRSFAGASGALRILLVEATLACAVTVMAQAFKAVGRPGVVTILQAIGLALCIPLMLWLIPKWGLAGAAAALLLSTLARFLFIYVSFRIFLRTRMPRLLPELEDFRFILSVVHTRLRREPALPEIAQ
jgi:O-antigen/teichoic acid export membrane protein